MPKPDEMETQTETEAAAENSLRIGIVLVGEMVEKFEAVKRRYGLQSNADLMRLLISQKYEESPARQLSTQVPMIAR